MIQFSTVRNGDFSELRDISQEEMILLKSMATPSKFRRKELGARESMLKKHEQ